MANGVRGRKPKLSPKRLAEMRMKYETTETSFGKLGLEYGMRTQSVHEWSQKQGWVKFQPPPKTEPPDRSAAEAFEADVVAETRAAYHEVLAKGLADLKPAKKPRAHRSKAPSKSAASSGKKAIPDGVSPLKPTDLADPVAAAAEPDPKPDTKHLGPGAHIIAFPGGHAPPPRPDTPLIFPTRSQEERASLRVQLSSLRGVMSVQQIQRLQRHQDLLEEYDHLIRVYLAPHKFVSAAGLSAEETEDLYWRVQRAALSQLLPTERDTLSGAIKTATSSLSVTVQLQRLVAGLAIKQARPPMTPSEFDDEGEGEGRSNAGEVTALDLAQLRTVRGAMQVLTGHRDRADEPPKPPEPEPLDDLVVDRPPIGEGDGV